MNNTIGFPPADALLEMISSVDYKKHLQQFVMLSATLLGITVGVLQFLYNKTAQWYNNGGKELMVNYINRAVLFINNRSGLFDKLYAATVSIYNQVELLAHRISDVTDVEVSQ